MVMAAKYADEELIIVQHVHPVVLQMLIESGNVTDAVQEVQDALQEEYVKNADHLMSMKVN